MNYMKNPDPVLNRNVKDQVSLKASHSPHSDLREPGVIEFTFDAEKFILGKIMKCIVAGIQESMGDAFIGVGKIKEISTSSSKTPSA
jgi:hypothetical protein